MHVHNIRITQADDVRVRVTRQEAWTSFLPRIREEESAERSELHRCLQTTVRCYLDSRVSKERHYIMIFTSTDPVPAPSIHDANHIDSVRIRLHHLMTSSDLSTNPASEHLWKSIDQITSRLSSLASFMPPGSTPGNHYRVLLLYICRILLLFSPFSCLPNLAVSCS